MKTEFAGLMAAFLRRYHLRRRCFESTQCEKPELSQTSIIHIHVSPALTPRRPLEIEIGDLFDGKTQFSFKIDLKYLLFADAHSWASQANRLGLFELPLGPGGTSLPLVAHGFNTLLYNSVAGYEQLLMGTNGQFLHQSERVNSRV